MKIVVIGGIGMIGSLVVPANHVDEIGEPARVRMSDFVRTALERVGDTREVRADPRAKYFATELNDDSLVPGPDAWLSPITYRDWVAAQNH